MNSVKPWYSAVLSMSICITLSIPIFIYIIDLTKPTQEQIELCSKPNVVCDSFTPIIYIGVIIGILSLYFFLTHVFDNYITSQKNHSVKESK